MSRLFFAACCALVLACSSRATHSVGSSDSGSTGGSSSGGTAGSGGSSAGNAGMGGSAGGSGGASSGGVGATSGSGGNGGDGGNGGSGGSAGTAPVSTFCDAKLQALAAGSVLFCADFDDPSAPLGAWIAEAFVRDAFTEELLYGGTASLSPGSLGANASGQRLVFDKPANAGSSLDTGAKYKSSFSATEPARGLRISFDIVVTRQSPVLPLGFLTLTEGIYLYGEDNNGSPAFVANDSTKALFGSGSAGTLWHIDLVIDPDTANGQYIFSGSLNGVPIALNGGAQQTIAQSIGTSLNLELKASTLISSDGSAVVQYDNLLITEFD